MSLVRHKGWLLGIGSLLLVYCLYELWGHPLVRGMYEQTLPLAFLNQLIKRRALHPLDYYTDKADAAVRGLLLAGLLGGALGWGYGWMRRRWPAWVFSRPVWGALWLSTTCCWLLYLFQVPLFQLLPHWFWSLHLTPLPWGWLFFPLLGLGLLVVRAVLAQPGRQGRHLVLVILLGLAVQYGFAWMEGRGLEGLARRLQGNGGHARLAQEAVAQESLWRVLTQYERLVERGELGAFPHATRPPGQLLFLMLADRAAQWTGGAEEPVERLARLAAWVLPLLSCLVAIPLFYLCRLLLPGQNAWSPALLYLAMPSVALIALHLDQCLYPPVAWSGVCLYAYALRRGWPMAAVGAGLLFYLGLFLSFSLVAVGAVLAILHLGAVFEQGRRVWRSAALAGAGFAGAAALCYFFFDYDLLLRYSRALEAHERFKAISWDAGTVFYCALLNLLEFALWCGPPLAVLCMAQLREAGRRRQWGGAGGLALALAVVLGSLAFLGRTAGETARLWIFVAPLVAMVAAGPLGEGEREVRVRAMGWVMALQLGTILVLKRYQDFF